MNITEIMGLIYNFGLVALIIAATAAAYQISKFYQHKNHQIEKAGAGPSASLREIEAAVLRAVAEAQAAPGSEPDRVRGRIEIPDDDEYGEAGGERTNSRRRGRAV